ncbi:MAG: tetratricopeptide repeat protein, partial [Thermoguttaceae bacterium]
MPTFKTFLMIGWILLTAVSLVYAQAEAQKAYQDAKTAYQAGNFADARDLAEKAAQTDPKNPEVFLLLGQARYQLGQVDEAVAAWKQTLALAPKQAFAARMLEVLQAQRAGVDVRIAFVEMLLAEKLFDPAEQEIRKLFSDKAISDLQRAKLLLLQVESFLGQGKPLEADKSIREVMALYPQQADPLQISLLLGRAKIDIGGQAVGEGLMLLKKLVAEHPDAPAANAARYELLIYDLKQNVTAEKAIALAKWIGENPKHAQANDARRLLVEFYLKLFKQEKWNEYASRTSPDWWRMRISLSRLLAYDLLLPDDPIWLDVMRHHAELLSAFAKFQFERNCKAGSAAANENISDIQNDLLDALHKRIARDATYAPTARALLREHLAPWTENHDWAVVDQMYAALAAFMPDAERRRTEIALASIWVQRVFDEHERLLKAGLTVPQRLDPLHEKALKRLYELQSGLDPQSPEIKEIRDVLSAVVAHYAKSLEYDDVAQAAIGVKAEKSVPVADEFAAFQTAQLQNDRADLQFSRLAKQYGTADKITMTPGYENALAAWMKFITDHQAGPLTSQAAQRIFAVGQIFERHQAYDVAADVYGKLAKFAAGVKSLSQATPNVPTTVENAEFARAAALDLQARKLLQKAMAQRKDKSAAPDKISPEFSAAIAAYKDFIGKYNESPLIGEAIAKIMAVGVEYARLDAWEAAESVYADLLDAKLNIRRPERLQFARGLCQLGPAMPDHAREILSALSLIDKKESKESIELGDRLDVAVIAGRSVRGGGAGAAGAGVGKKDSLPLANSSPASAATPINPLGSDALASHSEKQAEAGREAQLLAMIQNQESDRARQVAQIRDNPARFVANQPAPPQQSQAPARGIPFSSPPALSEQELARQEKAIAAAYEIFQSILNKYPDTLTAHQSRAEIMVMAGHWRGLSQWLKAAQLTARFLTDNPSDAQLPQLRMEIARDRLAWAAKPLERKATRQELLAEVASRFTAAREEFAKIIAEFPKEQTVVEDAQWDIATSFLAEARVIDSVSPTLARGQYVRTAKELAHVALKYPDHPRIGSVGQMLWDIAAELSARAYDEDAIAVWEELLRYDPLNARAQESAMRIAQTYQQKLKRPLRAAEVYQELNFIRGGNDQGLQNSIFQIGSE